MSSSFCAKCNYELAGLPPRGHCPECGQRYDIITRLGTKRGDSASTRGARLMRRITAIGLSVLGLGLIGLGFYFKFAHQREHALTIGGFFGVMLLLGAGIAILGEKED